MVQSHPAFGSFNPKVFIWTFLDKFQTYKLLLCLFLISDATGMQISRPYTVVLPSLQVDPSEREFDGRRFYLMIKLYPEGTLTPTLNPVVAGEFHNFQHSPSVLGGLLPPWVFKSKTMYLKLWLTLRKIKWNEGIFWNFPCWRKSVLMMKNWYICLVPLFLSFSCHTLQWGAPTFFKLHWLLPMLKYFLFDLDSSAVIARNVLGGSSVF